MAKGQKSGGRVAGTPNKRTQEVSELLEALGCNPIEGMARIAMNEKHSPELRGRMYAELAQYVAPKRKAIELGIDKDTLGVAETLRAARDAYLAEQKALPPAEPHSPER